MLRRLHMPGLADTHVAARLLLGDAEAHHARDVLRLEPSTEVELFDDAGTIVLGVIEQCDPGAVVVRVRSIREISRLPRSITIAAAIPKGDRADWMIEKLSEIGVTRFAPLIARRSVVVPAGQNKFGRWRRIATESAKQCRRTGVMEILPAMAVTEFLKSAPSAAIAVLSTAPNLQPIQNWLSTVDASREIVLLVGPEGGWADEELDAFAALPAVMLTETILRIETAAIVAAAMCSALTR